MFCRNTLCNAELAEYINTEMLFWACNTNSPEGYRGVHCFTACCIFKRTGKADVSQQLCSVTTASRKNSVLSHFAVSQALRENTYPFLALVVLRDNKMTVVARIEGPIGTL